MHGYNDAVKAVFVACIVLLEAVLGKHFTDLWAVHIKGGENVAKNVSTRHGFIYRGQIMPDYYHFQHRKVAKRSVYASDHYNKPLTDDSDILWVEQQIAKSRQKRSVQFNDPKWPIMWYLNRGTSLDLNVRKAWEMGYTGKGVVVTILDDGIEKDHPDLSRNYDENASYDVNGHDPDPQPRYDFNNENRHGTRCAGEVAAQADNHVCSVGVAFNARIGGVRMLDGDVTDSVEAQSLGLNPQHIHIYSASWGPDDDGRTVDGPATLARKAFYDGITKGRGSLGSIFVWASGNGGRDSDNCNCDGYTNSIYTLSISSATENGNIPWYSEACSSTLATTYSSGSGGEKQIVTTDLRQSCTETHTGTSASAPLAAGIIALALEANPSLTWRDMQHVVVETAKPHNLNADDWVINGVGKKVSHSFGFGLMDAAAMVSMARNWTTVPEQHICEIRSQDHNSQQIPMNGRITVTLYTDGCEGTGNHVKYLEHVQARITMTASRRGEITIFLSSPSLTKSTLLAKRARDLSREGFNNWAFMTTHNWGESAKGQWTLEIENSVSTSRPNRLRDWVLVLYGTDSPPRKSPTSVRSPHYDFGQHLTVRGSQDRRADRRQPSYDSFNFQHDHEYYRETHPPTTTTTTTTTASTTTITQYNHRDSHLYPWSGHESHQLNGHWPPSSSSSSSSTNQRKNTDSFYFWDPFYQAYASQPNHAHQPGTQHRHHHPEHTCVYETLAKKSNISAIQFVRKKRPQLTAAELKEWTLVMMGTSGQQPKQNGSQAGTSASLQKGQAFACAGVMTNGICIECKPGFFKMGDDCVAHCPQHYFGRVQAVQLAANSKHNYSKPLLHTQGVCLPCHESCLTCRGSVANDCFQCASGFERKGEMCEKMIWDLLDPDVMKHLAWAIILCIAAILLFSVVFGILQAKDRGRLCWRSKPNYVPDWSKGHYDGVTPHYAMQDSDNETELPPPAKIQTFFPLTVAYKYHHSTGAQNV